MLDAVERTGYRIAFPREKALWRPRRRFSRRSRTFRSGTAGGWRERFTPEHKRLFLDVAGDLLVQLGYERNDNW
jgi:hypothetical protein